MKSLNKTYLALFILSIFVTCIFAQVDNGNYHEIGGNDATISKLPTESYNNNVTSTTGVWTENTDLSWKLTMGIGEWGPPYSELGAYLNQSQFRFETYPNYYINFQVKYDGGDWITVDAGQGIQTPWITPTWTNIGTHSMEIKYSLVSGSPRHYNFTVFVVPPRDKIYYDGTGNWFDVWLGNSTTIDRPFLFVEGLDAENKYWPNYYYGLATDFLDEMRSLDADVMILNLDEGGDDIANNAQIVKDATNFIDEIRDGNQQTILAGLSMGGVVARYALAEAEEEGSPLNVSHFLSIDSPQKYAVIPSDFQDYINERDNGTPQVSLNSMAAKQMLIYNTYDNTIHTPFYEELNALNGNGYPSPSLCKSIGVSFSPNTENPYSGTWLEVELVDHITVKEFKINTGDAWKLPGSYLPEEITNMGGFWYGLDWELNRLKHPTFIPHESALNITNGITQFDQTISSSEHNFHDRFPEDLIDPIAIALGLTPASTVDAIFWNIIDNSDDAGGQIKVTNSWNQSFTVNSGGTVPLLNNEIHNVETLNQKRIDFQSGTTDYQHHEWNNLYDLYKLKRPFPGWDNDGEQYAIFSALDNTAKVGTELLSGGIGGEIEFKDPWYKETDGSQPANFLSYNSPFTPGVNTNYDYTGIFLNQWYDIFNHPYYSVKVPMEQTIPFHSQNVIWYFQRWEGTNVQFENAAENETPIVFKNTNAEARAVYKGHLASNHSNATGYNNGRRVVYSYINSSTTRIDMVYEDNGEIWHSYTSDNGQSWSEDEMISSGEYGNCKNPSLAVHDGTSLLFAVWERYDETNGKKYIEYCLGENGGWNWPETFYQGYGSAESRPVVAAFYQDRFALAWRFKVTSGSSYKTYYCTYETITENKTGFTNVPGNNYPSIAANPFESRICLVWSENGQLRTCIRSGTGTWSSEKILAVWPDFTSHDKPSASLDNGQCHVSFECEMSPMGPPMGGGTPTVGYGYFDISQSNPSFYFYIVETNGTIEGNTSIGKGSNVSIIYERGGNIIRRNKSGYSWNEANFSDGNYPNISYNSQTGAVWTKFTSAPYLIKSELGSGGLAKVVGETESITYEESKRFYYPLAARFEDSFDSYIVQLDGMYVNGKLCHFDDQLQSESLKLKKKNEIELLWSVFSDYVPDNIILMRFYFKTEKGKYLLDTITSDELWPVQKEEVQNVYKRLDYYINEKMDGTVIIEFDKNDPYIATVLNDETESVLAKHSATNEDFMEIIPEEFGLGQNFPNPFNPTTQISFDLPQDSQISLKVFDINGREVANLVEGYKVAGRYQVLFDGSSLSSGVYIYRLKAGGFNSVKRMLLVK